MASLFGWISRGKAKKTSDAISVVDLLKEGGRIDMPIGELPWSPCAASIVDRFGIWWYLSSASHRPPEDYDYWNGKPLSTGEQ